MSDYSDYEQEAGMEAFIEEHLRLISEEPVFYYLSRYGDDRRGLFDQRVTATAYVHGEVAATAEKVVRDLQHFKIYAA